MDQHSEEARELQEELFELKKLRDSRGYQWLLNLASEQVASRTQLLLQPLTTHDAVLMQEFAKGEMAGINLFMKIIDIHTESLEEQIQDLIDAAKPQENQSEQEIDGSESRNS
jgi:hypothetical protein